jgi:hypothetical protein
MARKPKEVLDMAEEQIETVVEAVVEKVEAVAEAVVEAVVEEVRPLSAATLLEMETGRKHLAEIAKSRVDETSDQ